MTFVKTDFQVLKLKFHACNFIGFLSSSNTLVYRVTLTTQKYFYTGFLLGIWLSNLRV